MARMKQNCTGKKKITRCLREAVAKTNKNDGETKYFAQTQVLPFMLQRIHLQSVVRGKFSFSFLSLSLSHSLPSRKISTDRFCRWLSRIHFFFFFHTKTKLSSREALVCRNDKQMRTELPMTTALWVLDKQKPQLKFEFFQRALTLSCRQFSLMTYLEYYSNETLKKINQS